MGCYGIGVTRIVAPPSNRTTMSAASSGRPPSPRSQWCSARSATTATKLCARKPTSIYAELLAAGIDVILDDRGERPGVMFADWELIGVPHRVVVGDRGLKEGKVEYQGRRDAQATPVAVADVVGYVRTQLAS